MKNKDVGCMYSCANRDDDYYWARGKQSALVVPSDRGEGECGPSVDPRLGPLRSAQEHSITGSIYV